MTPAVPGVVRVSTERLLDVQGLTIALRVEGGYLEAVRGVDLSIDRGQVYGLAGESGSGKTLTALSLLGLLPGDARVGGIAMFHGSDLYQLSASQWRAVRGMRIAMVFQDPMSSLHPMMSIGKQLTEHARFHLGLSSEEAMARAADLLHTVRIPRPRDALRSHPHEFSGGQRQRIAIAIALMCEPDLLIADEPTTALDVTVQAGILRLLNQLRDERDLSILMITHNLGILSAFSNALSVMYGGRIVESGSAHTVLTRPRHPYTRGLIDALPDPERRGKTLSPIGGSPPSLRGLPSGCTFHPRCRFAEERCSRSIPELEPVDGHHEIACFVDPFVGGTA